MNFIPLTGGFQSLLTASTGSAQVQCFSARNVFNQIQSEISEDYYAFIQLFIESFDVATNITSLNQAPLPDIGDLDTRSEQATKVYNIWMNYEKIGIQLLYDDGGGLFRKQGQPIIFQNVPFQLPVQYLRPYLSATQEVLLVGSSDRIGVQMLSGIGYQGLASNDEILIKGQWKAEVKLVEKKLQSIDSWYPIGVNLPADQPVVVRPFNKKRRALYVVNGGATDVRFFYGNASAVLSDTCPYLVPNGSFNQEFLGSYAIAQQLVALSVGGAGRLVGMEGSIT